MHDASGSPDRRRRRGRPPLAPDGASTIVHIRVSTATYDRLCRVAVRRRDSVTAMIRLAIERNLAQFESDSVS